MGEFVAKNVIYAVSDIHGTLPVIPICDLLIIAGDICPMCDHNVDYQKTWLDTHFRKWLDEIPAKKVVGVAGNHDIIFDRNPELVPQDLRWTYLHDEMITIDEIDIYGSSLTMYGTPYQIYFGGWPFMKSEEELEILWKDMPACDIVICHGPPYGAGDQTSRGPQGSKTLANKLQELKILS